MLSGFTATLSNLFGSSSPSTPIIWTHVQLLNTEFAPQPWIVEGLVPDGALTIMAGKKKLGKSWLALQMSQAVASGTTFLGRATTQGPVLYLALEDGPRRLNLRIKKQGGPSDLPITYITTLDPLNRNGKAQLAMLIDRLAPKLVIIDTLAAAKSGKVEENDAGDMADLFNPLRKMAQDLNVGILVVAHHGKTQRGDPGDDVRGSSALGAAADMIIGLYREGDRTSLRTLGRDVEEGDFCIVFDPIDGTWSVPTDARRLARTEAEAGALTAVESLGEADADSVAAHIGKDRSTVQTTLKRLRDEERLGHRTEPAGRIVYFLPPKV
jgi:hypothetical protein